ncbi:TEA-domain-containing protein [Pseudovirgaria hyperparasitica]|uniref:TEA-domain-containing protein n=1 Tax=Pseudovirgaria hyperparasitica TaxID=470096 RepID=A0A6A6W8C6_9PEZI|nr:TEA-domain-containing protein [Pseudovirgaria hyperparasitica]KAF2758795.1 TEA-domain-containing protein [Pseudovirgaria hyperparasitica]
MEPCGHISPPVLPSNAPALSPPIYGGHSSRALQERSSNAQRDGYEQDLRKISDASSTENRYGKMSPSLASHEHPADQEKKKSDSPAEREFAALWRRLESSEAYKKYRARQPRDANEQDQKWPEHMEAAFFRALVKYEPMGRRKQTLNGTLRGRNELIADEILKLTKEKRNRKQVSSHLQVLKTLLKNDPMIMRYLSKEDFQDRKRRPSCAHLSRRRRRPHTAQAAAISNATYQALSLPWQTESLAETPCLASPDSPIPAPLWSGTLMPSHFDVYVRDSYMRAIHTHTSFSASPQGDDVRLESLPNLASAYPPLAELVSQTNLADEATSLPNVVLMHASFDIHTDPLPGNAEICIREEFDAQPGLGVFEHFECRTTFLLDGVETEKVSGEIKEHDIEAGRLSGTPFGSMFWAYRFTQLAKKLRDTGTGDGEGNRAEVAGILSRMSAVQEIFASGDKWQRSQRILLVAWRFSLAPLGLPGTSTWHRVRVPSADEVACLTASAADLEMLYAGQANLDRYAGHGHDDLYSATAAAAPPPTTTAGGECSNYAESFRSALTTPHTGTPVDERTYFDASTTAHEITTLSGAALADLSTTTATLAEMASCGGAQLEHTHVHPHNDDDDDTIQPGIEDSEPHTHTHPASLSTSTSAPSLSRSTSTDHLRASPDFPLQPSIQEFCIAPSAVYHAIQQHVSPSQLTHHDGDGCGMGTAGHGHGHGHGGDTHHAGAYHHHFHHHHAQRWAGIYDELLVGPDGVEVEGGEGGFEGFEGLCAGGGAVGGGVGSGNGNGNGKVEGWVGGF